MKFSIIHIKPLSGKYAQVYTLQYEDKYASELRMFTDKFNDSHPEIIQSIFQRIYTITNRDSIQDSFFKRESSESHHVFRLMETDDLRIYCIMFSNIIFLFGSGGIKPPKSRKNIENPHLQREIDKLIKIENCINFYLDAKEIKITENGFEGNLIDLEI